MGYGRWLSKILRTIALLLVFLAVFSLIYGYLDTASAPFITAREDAARNTGDTPPQAAEAPAVTPAVPFSLQAPRIQDDFITIRLDASEIARGSLLLVNQDYRYEVTGDNDFLQVSDMKTQSYMVPDADIILDALAIGPLNEMMDAFYDETGRDNIAVVSGFRDFNRQQEILDDYIKLTGPVEALKWAAPPGYSEHHTGLAIDLGIFSSGTFRTFTGTGINAWFKNNCYRFGFIHRYTKEKTDLTGTVEEPWHFRYTGNPHAYFIYSSGWCLEEYIEFIRGYSYEEPYTGQYDGETYEIYYTSGEEMRIPFDYEFDFSGDNIDGFIVTIKHQ